jgi:hypothetical protein
MLADSLIFSACLPRAFTSYLIRNAPIATALKITLTAPFTVGSTPTGHRQQLQQDSDQWGVAGSRIIPYHEL